MPVSAKDVAFVGDSLLLAASFTVLLFHSISRMDQFGLLILDESTTYRSNVSGSHRFLNVAPPLFIGGVSDAVSLAPQALTVQGELAKHPVHVQQQL